jgi:hypothetical protein
MTEASNSRTVRTVAIHDLKPYANNPYVYPRKQLRKIDALIRRHSQLPIILVTSDLTIIGGEEWWLALKMAGKTEVTVEILADLSPAEANTVRLALARLPLDARLDTGRLRAEFAALQAAGADLELTGFDQGEIDISLELDLPRANVAEDPNEIAKPQDRAVSKLGDIFDLVCHRVGCGDPRDRAFIERLCNRRKPLLAIADQPFSPNLSSFNDGRHSHRNFIDASMFEVDLHSSLSELLGVLRSVATPSALLFIFTDWRCLLPLLAAGKQLGLPLLNICVCAKANGAVGGMYRSAHELCGVFKAGTEPHRNNLDRSGRKRLDLWQYPPPAGDQDQAAKPVALLADILKDGTKRGDLVIEIFGAGSTLIAAEETGRNCVSLESDPRYLDVAIRRWQAITGRDAIHVQTGQRFDDMEQRLLVHREGRHGA